MSDASNSRQFHLHGGQKGAALAIRVIPRSSHNEIAEVLSDGSIKIRLTASQADDKTNGALVQFLAGVLEIPPANIDIVAGLNGRDKLVSILNLDADTVHQRILKKLA